LLNNITNLLDHESMWEEFFVIWPKPSTVSITKPFWLNCITMVSRGRVFYGLSHTLNIGNKNLAYLPIHLI
jgi:hypothetical protein